MLTALKKKIPFPIKFKIKQAIHRIRMLSWKYRHSPAFIIIGGQKCGTTSLYNYLAQHPQILPCARKEIHYFDNGLQRSQKHFEKGEAWYRAHFPLRITSPKNAITFEASPMYCFNPDVAKRIYEFDPRIKIIFCIRNPRDRAISHYYHEIRHGRESLPMLKAFEKEEARISDALAKKDYQCPAFTNFTYKSRGLYFEQLERFLKYFNSNQIHLMSSEELFSAPDETLKEIYRFLEVDDNFNVPNLKPVNVSPLKKEVDEKVSEHLIQHFELPNNKFFELAGKNYDWQ
jgi:hypothetical protein